MPALELIQSGWLHDSHPAGRVLKPSTDPAGQTGRMTGRLGALILAGGTSRRMAGVDKCAIDVNGIPIIDRVIAAVRPLVGPQSGRIVIVGPPRDTRHPTARAREEPPGSGPLAAIAAGLGVLLGSASESDAGSPDNPAPHSPGDRVLLLAGDIPFPGPGLDVVLAEAVDVTADVVLGHDQRERDQFLFACWRSHSLRAAVARHRGSDPVRLLYDGVRVERRELPAESTIDCDTADDLERARSIARGQRPDSTTSPRG